MKLKSDVSASKLRGGYYTPSDLASFCWRRVIKLADSGQLRVLEPAAGDGQFFQPLNQGVADRIDKIVAVEIDGAEAAKCRLALARLGTPFVVHDGSFLSWALNDDEQFDIAVGNPPFVRFQFVSRDDASAAVVLGMKLGLRIEGVSNLWLPILLGAFAKLRTGGAASFVVPAEIFTGMSAGTARRWLLENTSDLSIDLFPPGSFPDVLQEVVVLTARRAAAGCGTRRVTVISHVRGASQQWTHELSANEGPWTRLLITPKQADAVAEAASLGVVVQLGDIAKIQVSIVTGANDFFSIDRATCDRFKLERWCVPLLPRARYARGLIWRRREQNQLPDDAKGWLLHFADNRPSPTRHRLASEYLEVGSRLGIPQRYKCRIRTPWYRVPDVWSGSLLLSKRSHQYPKLLLNAARTYTTDTIYRGRMKVAYRGRERDLVASFHNSITMLTAELEGRSFGGGVHELVPSEIGRLLVPLASGSGESLDELDAVARDVLREPNDLITKTDELLVRADVGITRQLLEQVSVARRVLMQRRLDRASAVDATLADEIDLLAV